MSAATFNKYIEIISGLPEEVSFQDSQEEQFQTVERNRVLISATLNEHRNRIVNIHAKKQLPHDLEKLQVLIDKYRSSNRFSLNQEWRDDKSAILDILIVARDHKTQWYRSEAFKVGIAILGFTLLSGSLLKYCEAPESHSPSGTSTVAGSDGKASTVHQIFGNITINNNFYGGVNILLLPDSIVTKSDSTGKFSFSVKNSRIQRSLKITYNNRDTIISLNKALKKEPLAIKLTTDHTIYLRQLEYARKKAVEDVSEEAKHKIIPFAKIDTSLSDMGYNFKYRLKDHLDEWIFNNCNCELYLIDGILTYKGKAATVGNVGTTLSFDPGKDFLITAKFKWINGDKAKNFGVTFDHDAHMNDSYRFHISADGLFHSVHLKHGTSLDWVDVRSDFVNKGVAVNILQIKKSNGLVAGFLNGHQMSTYKYRAMKGSIVGLSNFGKQVVQILDFRVDAYK